MRPIIEGSQPLAMASVERVRDRGNRQARRLLRDLGTELREVRLGAGLSQRAVARAAGLNQSRISRTEHAQRIPARLDELAAHCAVLGLRLSVKAYPDGSPVRDAGQLRLLDRLRLRLHPRFHWRSEVLVGGPGDLRAWDVQLDGPGSIGVDAETQLRDIQAVQRRIETKARDSGVDRVVMLVAATRHNRLALSLHRRALASTFPADTGEILLALRRGQLPERNGIVVL